MYPISADFFYVYQWFVLLYSFFKVSLLCADDLQIYLSEDRNDLDAMISALNEDLAAISRWLAENGLLLNRHKSQEILILNSTVGMVLPTLFLGMVWCRYWRGGGHWWSSSFWSSGYEGVFEGLYNTAQTAFAEVSDAEAGQIEALQALASSVFLLLWCCFFASVLRRQQTFADGF
jgi:hypothetical protein